MTVVRTPSPSAERFSVRTQRVYVVDPAFGPPLAVYLWADFNGSLRSLALSSTHKFNEPRAAPALGFGLRVYAPALASGRDRRPRGLPSGCLPPAAATLP